MSDKVCKCGVAFKVHRICGACGAPICAEHKDTTLDLFRGHSICPDCRSYWLVKDQVEKRETTWEEFTTGQIKVKLSPSYLDKRGRLRKRTAKNTSAMLRP